MKCLAIDTSGAHLTVALIDGDKVFSDFTLDTGLKHSISLMPKIEEVIKKANVSLSEIDLFSAVIGPGSFTGIRIGVSTVKAFSYAFNKKVLPVTSFEVLEYNKPCGKNLAIIDARHDNYYACGYTDNRISIEPTFLSGEEILKLSSEYEVLSSNKGELVTTQCDLLKGLVEAVKAKISLGVDREELIPLYVKKSQAEEGL